jgi:signal transduction histidine kinase
VASLEFAVAEAFAGGSSEDVRVTTASATPAVISFNVTPRPGGDGTIRGAVCIGRDITARLEAERVKAENVAMARSAKLKDEFLAGMSHELRTPLNAIIGLSSVLGRKTFGPLTERQEAYVQQIGDSGAHLLSLINDVLDLAKIDATGTQLDLEEVDVAAMGRTAVAAVAPLAAERGHTVHEPAADPVVIRADRRRVHQVMLNLLSNAVKFMHDGGEMGLEVNAVPGGAEIVVWDRGVGIPDDVRHLLFEPFQQIDGSLAREHDGTGLGLALVAKLVELHGGRVEVESSSDEGSRFVVTLPAVPLPGRVPEPVPAHA